MTVRQYLNTLPLKASQKALKNTPKEVLENKAESTADALGHFNWKKSPEGYDYWATLLTYY